MTQPEFFNRDFQKRIFAEFSGLFHRANSYDHCPEIKFQRIWPKFFEFFSDISFADGDVIQIKKILNNTHKHAYDRFRESMKKSTAVGIFFVDRLGTIDLTGSDSFMEGVMGPGTGGIYRDIRS